MDDSGAFTSGRLTSHTQPILEHVGALVIGGDYRGLGIVRSLGRHGIPVWVLADEHMLAATSRYARRSLRWPTMPEDRQIDYLLDLGERQRLDMWVIFPTGDETAALIARNYTVLMERFQLAVPPWEMLRWSFDKRVTYRLAAQLGVAHPWTR